jgi:4-aminobutyrate aminotransferase-like enzyme
MRWRRRPGSFANVIGLQPPRTLTAAEADRICDVFSDAVGKLSAGKK